jgi:NADH-quinone oxidoreductase subunit H
MSWYESPVLQPVYAKGMEILSPLIGKTGAQLILSLIESVLIIIVIFLNVLVIVWLERKILGRMMNRRGPVYAGPPLLWGLFQAIADFLKLMTKEFFIPRRADRLTYIIGPALVVFAGLAIGLMVPFGEGFVGLKNEASLIYIIALASLEPMGVMLCGLSANNKFSLMGGMRAAAQMISYELPAVLVLISVAVLAGSVDILEIAESQSQMWYAAILPLGALLFLITILAELERTPFDIPEAESELVAGFMTEYGGMFYGMLMAAHYISVFVTSALFVTVFLGGYGLPFGLNAAFEMLPPALASLSTFLLFHVKVYIVVFLLIWIRAAYFRLRIDQLLELGWKRLFPLSLLNLVWAIAALGVLA